MWISSQSIHGLLPTIFLLKILSLGLWVQREERICCQFISLFSWSMPLEETTMSLPRANCQARTSSWTRSCRCYQFLSWWFQMESSWNDSTSSWRCKHIEFEFPCKEIKQWRRSVVFLIVPSVYITSSARSSTFSMSHSIRVITNKWWAVASVDLGPRDDDCPRGTLQEKICGKWPPNAHHKEKCWCGINVQEEAILTSVLIKLWFLVSQSSQAYKRKLIYITWVNTCVVINVLCAPKGEKRRFCSARNWWIVIQELKSEPRRPDSIRRSLFSNFLKEKWRLFSPEGRMELFICLKSEKLSAVFWKYVLITCRWDK